MGASHPRCLRLRQSLTVPLDFGLTQEVTVPGEVQNATSPIYKPVSRATKRADREQIYMVRADGSVGARRWSASA